jgi:hypothetical protein
LYDGYHTTKRDWYLLQNKNRNTTTLTDIYKFKSSGLGLTNCVPLISANQSNYYGAYCYDIYATSLNKSFVQNYFSF